MGEEWVQGPQWLDYLEADKEEDDNIAEYADEDSEDEDRYDSDSEYHIKFQRCVSDCLLILSCIGLSQTQEVLAVQIR